MTMTIPQVVFTAALLLASQLSNGFAPLAGITARSVKLREDVDLSEFVCTPATKGEKSMLVLGTYAADFNAIEYAQRYVDNSGCSTQFKYILLPLTSCSDCDTTCPICTREASRK